MQAVDSLATDELIEHILTRYHQVHRQQFPELIALSEKVHNRHGDDPNAPKGLTALLEYMQSELTNHMLKEEEVLFPMMRQGMFPVGPISVMEAEHQEHDQALAKLKSLTHDFTPPAGACNSWQALYQGLKTLHDDLIEHIRLENTVLFLRTQ